MRRESGDPLALAVLPLPPYCESLRSMDPHRYLLLVLLPLTLVVLSLVAVMAVAVVVEPVVVVPLLCGLGAPPPGLLDRCNALDV